MSSFSIGRVAQRLDCPDKRVLMHQVRQPQLQEAIRLVQPNQRGEILPLHLRRLEQDAATIAARNGQDAVNPLQPAHESGLADRAVRDLPVLREASIVYAQTLALKKIAPHRSGGG